MTLYRRGAVVLASFPHTDKPESKQRPALVISSDDYNRTGPDIVVAQITSQVTGRRRPGDCRISDWRAAGLVKPALVRARLTSIHSRLVVRPLGNMPADEMARVDSHLQAALGFTK